MAEFSTPMGAAQRHFDNLSPDDFGPPAEVDCARCLQAVETHTTDYCRIDGEWTCRSECLVICEDCGETGPLEGATRDEDGWICPDCGTGGEEVASPAGKPGDSWEGVQDMNADLTAQFENAKAKWRDAAAECEGLKADVESYRAGGPGKRNDKAAGRALYALRNARFRRRKLHKLARKAGADMNADLTNTAGLGYDRDVLAAAQRIEAAALVLAALIDGASPDVCKRAEALLLDKSTAPTEPRRHGPPAWRRLFFIDVAEAANRRGGA